MNAKDEFYTEWLTAIETQRANKFYRKFHFKGKVKTHDHCMVVKDQNKQIVACGFLRDYQTFNLLSGVAVAPYLQNRGLARMLLAKLSAQFDNETFTFPYSNLVTLYRKLCFELVQQPSIPNDVQNLFNRYVNQGRNIAVMKYQPD